MRWRASRITTAGMTCFGGAIVGNPTASGAHPGAGVRTGPPSGSVTGVMIRRADGLPIVLAGARRPVGFVAATEELDQARITAVPGSRDHRRCCCCGVRPQGTGHGRRG